MANNIQEYKLRPGVCPLDSTEFSRVQFESFDLAPSLMPEWFYMAGNVCPTCLLGSFDQSLFIKPKPNQAQGYNRSVALKERESPFNPHSSAHRTLDSMLGLRVNAVDEALHWFSKEEIMVLLRDRIINVSTSLDKSISSSFNFVSADNAGEAKRYLLSCIASSFPEAVVFLLRRSRSGGRISDKSLSDDVSSRVIAAQVYGALVAGFDDFCVQKRPSDAISDTIRQRAYLKLSQIHSNLDRISVYGLLLSEFSRISSRLPAHSLQDYASLRINADPLIDNIFSQGSKQGYHFLNLGRSFYRSFLKAYRLHTEFGEFSPLSMHNLQVYGRSAAYFLKLSLKCERYPEFSAGDRPRLPCQDKQGTICVPFALGEPGVHYMLCYTNNLLGKVSQIESSPLIIEEKYPALSEPLTVPVEHGRQNSMHATREHWNLMMQQLTHLKYDRGFMSPLHPYVKALIGYCESFPDSCCFDFVADKTRRDISRLSIFH